MIVISLGIIQFILIAVILFYEFRCKSSSVFLWATLMIMFGLVHLMSSFSGDALYSDATLSKASLFVIGFCSIYLLTRASFGKLIQKKNREYFKFEVIRERVLSSDNKDLFLFVLFTIVVVLKLYPFINSSGGIMLTSWGSGRSYTSTLSYLNTNQITSILFFTLSGITVYYWIKKEFKLCILSCLLIFSEVIITRNRIEVLPLICAFTAIAIYKNKKITFKQVLLGSIGAVAVIYVVYGLWVFRHYGSIASFLQSFELRDFIDRINNHLRYDTDNGELNYRKWFYFFIQNGNHFPNFNRGHTYIRMLLVYIPTRWSFGIKPTDFAISMGSAIGMGAGGSMHPTLFADCYANLNVFGVLLGLFWGIYVTIIDKITIKRKPLDAILIYIVNSIAYVIIGRGSVYNAFVIVAYSIPIIIAFSYLRNHVRFKIH